jgi:HEAT repeat protein
MSDSDQHERKQVPQEVDRKEIMSRLETLAQRLEEDVGRLVQALQQVPQQVLDEMVGDVTELAELADSSTVRVMRLLAHDAREDVRARVASVIGDVESSQLLSLEEREATLKLLAGDPHPLVRCKTSKALAAWFGQLEPLRYAEVVCEWSLSRNRYVRATLAQALTHSDWGVGAPTAVRYLTDDPHPEVSQSAAAAGGKIFTNRS